MRPKLTHSAKLTVMLAAASVVMTESATAASWIPAAGSPFPAGVAKPAALAVADLNHDGHLDVVAGNSDATGATISVLLGDGTGAVHAAGPPLATGAIPVALDVGDLDNDDNLDVVAGYHVPDSGNGRGTVSLLLGDGDGGLLPAGDPMPVGGAVSALALGDFTGDGTPDAAVSHRPDPEGTTYYTFTIAGAIGTGEDGGLYPFWRDNASTQNMSVGDMNSDGRADAVAGGNSRVDVLLGQGRDGVIHGTGCSPDCGNEPNPYSIPTASLTLGDYDGDENLDAGVGNFFKETVTVLIGDGAGALTRMSPALKFTLFRPSAVSAGDFNRDGALDLAVADAQRGEFTALFGDGAGHLSDMGARVPTGATGATGGAAHAWPEALRVGDFDEDGRPDAVVANVNHGTISVLLYRHGYVRPRNAGFVRVPLVPAFARCAVFNRTHGPPQEYRSCAPPRPLSNLLTVGTADSNQAPTGSTGSVTLEAIAGVPNTPADEADLRVTTSITDVRNASDLSDYTGFVDVVLPVRLTDRLLASAAEGSQTTQNFPVLVSVPCNPTSATTIGATCELTTTVDTVVPGAVAELKRSVWALDAVRVFDTEGGRFQTQGVFVP